MTQEGIHVFGDTSVTVSGGRFFDGSEGVTVGEGEELAGRLDAVANVAGCGADWAPQAVSSRRP